MEAFYPWVGINYSNGSIFGKKIFILGESVYCEEPEECGACFPGAVNLCNYFIIHIVLSNIFEKCHTPLYTKIYRLLVDEQEVSKEQFWNSIAFSNYVQTSVSNKSRVRPTPEMWEQGKNEFVTTIKRLEPQKMIVLGYDLWNNLPDSPVADWEKISNNNDIGASIYKTRIGELKFETALIRHPQRFGFDYSEREFLNAFVKQ